MADKIEWHPNGSSGPWSVERHPHSGHALVADAEGYVIADCLNGEITTEQEETNARATAEVPAMVQALREDVAEYDRLNPMRTADMHRTDCRCERCRIDEKRAILARIDKEA